LNITTKLKNDMIEIIGYKEIRVGDKIRIYADVKKNGCLFPKYVGERDIAPTSTNMNPSFS